MPILGTLILGLFRGLLAVFGRFFVLEKAFKLAAIGSTLILATGLTLALKSCVNGVCGAAIGGISASHHNFAVGLGMAFNSTTYTAASCYVTVWMLCQLYVLKKRMIAML